MIWPNFNPTNKILYKKCIMKKNMGNIDRLIRVMIALTAVVLYFTNRITGLVATFGLILSGIFILTSFIGFCPLYWPFNVCTNKK
jgi:hypothetical protein